MKCQGKELRDKMSGSAGCVREKELRNKMSGRAGCVGEKNFATKCREVEWS